MPATNNSRSRAKREDNNQVAPLNGKLPPQATELEEDVLGGIMIDTHAYSEVANILTARSFYVPKHRLIYEAIVHLASANQPIDMFTVMEQLKRDKNYDAVDAMTTLPYLTQKVVTTANIVYHAQIIAQKSLARDLIQMSNQVLEQSYDESNDVEDVLRNAEGTIFQLSRTTQKKDVVQIDTIIDDAFSRIKAAADNDSQISGIPSGFNDLDKITSGWQNSDLIIIAARPAMGKTAFVLSMAKNMAVNYKRPVALFSLEMSNLQLVNRLIMNVCEIEGEKIRNGKLDDTEWARLDHNIKDLIGAPIYVDDTPSLSVLELRSKARRLKTEHNIECIIIDYLQLMNATGMNFGSREQEVSIISRNLKALAKELNIPVIALSQLNRQVETRGGTGVDGKRPQLSDLRESGAIEQDADMVCFIHRPEYYKIYDDGHGHDMRGMAQVIVAKHRSGKTGDVTLRFQQSYTKFLNVTDYSSSDYQSSPTTPSAATPASQEPQSYRMSSKLNSDSVDDDLDDSAELMKR